MPQFGHDLEKQVDLASLFPADSISQFAEEFGRDDVDCGFGGDADPANKT